MTHTNRNITRAEVMGILAAAAAEDVKLIPNYGRPPIHTNLRNMLMTLINLDMDKYGLVEIDKRATVSDVIFVLVDVVLYGKNDVVEYGPDAPHTYNIRKATNIITRMSYSEIDKMFENLFTTWGEMMTADDMFWAALTSSPNLTSKGYQMPAVMALRKLYYKHRL